MYLYPRKKQLNFNEHCLVSRLNLMIKKSLFAWSLHYLRPNFMDESSYTYRVIFDRLLLKLQKQSPVFYKNTLVPRVILKNFFFSPFSYGEKMRWGRGCYKKAVLTNFAILIRKRPRWSLFLIKFQIFRQVFSCEYCEIFKNTYFEEHLRTTASATCKIINIKTRTPRQDYKPLLFV